MNIVMISDNDPAGTGIMFCNAINRLTKHRCRLITTEERYGFDYETDIHIRENGNAEIQEVEQVLVSGDIFHFHMTKDENAFLGPLHIKDYLPGKRILHHHHGHPVFRSNPRPFRDKYIQLGRKAIVSTPDLLHLLPQAMWVPNLVPLNDPGHQPLAETRVNGTLRICQAPTRKDLKNTEAFIKVTSSLKNKYPIIEPWVIELTEHKKCLAIKQASHIHFDHMQGYYGVSSLESLSQGKPVIAGIDDWCSSHIAEFTGTDTLPWVIARNEEQLSYQLETLIRDDGLRTEKGLQARTFMTRFWNENRVVDRLMDVYASL